MLHVTIQLNENAEGNHDRWRLTINGAEHFVAGVHLKVKDLLTGAEVNQAGILSYHLECDADKFQIHNGLALIHINEMPFIEPEKIAEDLAHKIKLRALGNDFYRDFGQEV